MRKAALCARTEGIFRPGFKKIVSVVPYPGAAGADGTGEADGTDRNWPMRSETSSLYLYAPSPTTISGDRRKDSVMARKTDDGSPTLSLTGRSIISLDATSRNPQ